MYVNRLYLYIFKKQKIKKSIKIYVKIMWWFLTEIREINNTLQSRNNKLQLFIIYVYSDTCLERPILLLETIDHFTCVIPLFCAWDHLLWCETTISCVRQLLCVRNFLFLQETTISCQIDHYFVYKTLFSCVRPSFLMCETTISCATYSLMKLPQGTLYFNNKNITCFKRPSAFKDHNFWQKGVGGLSRWVSLYFCY